MRVLLVEDNVCTQMLMRDTLEILGCEQTTVCNGVEALAELRRSRYDVVLMDIEMPILNGTSTARSIRAEFGSQPRIFLTSARDGDELQKLCRESDIDGCLTKPVSVSELQFALTGTECEQPTQDQPVLEIPACLNAQHIFDLISIQDPGENLLEDLGSVFEERGQDILATLNAPANSGRNDEGRTLIHELKGCALAVGATKVAEICVQMESQGGLNSVALKALQSRFLESLEAVKLTVSLMKS